MTIDPGNAILTNGRLVLTDRIVTGSVVIENGLIAAIDEGPRRAAGAIDLAGDFLLPGLVELHTDNLEKHFVPRPGTKWPAMAAIVGHDAQVAAAGITTVFDALSVGEVSSGGDRLENLEGMTGAIRAASERDMLRAEHFLHLRCEISHADMPRLFRPFIGDPLLKLVSVMDHTPGQRQFTTLDSYRGYYVKKHGMTEEQFLAFVDRQLETSRLHGADNRALVIRLARENGLALASHDDATAAHVDESAAAGMEIAEFPTTIEAARASREAGMAILMGAPNVVRGGSHSGNVSALALAEHGLLDVLSSDYVPQSLLHGAFILAEAGIGWDLPRAVQAIAAEPARRVGLHDRGSIAIGLRADLIRVQEDRHLPLVRGVWTAGTRVI
ncbi:MAG: alpha-D-ribose 1-methylphosphonate 5-triphosphate diphosphatase [Aliidongia sp.]